MRQVSRLTSAVSFAKVVFPVVGYTNDRTSVCYAGLMPRVEGGSLNGRCCETKLPALSCCVCVCVCLSYTRFKRRGLAENTP